MKPVQQEMFETEKHQQSIRVFTDGSGARLDGKGSGYAFICPDTGEKQVIPENGLTNNQAEYKAVILALESVSKGSIIEISLDSQVICAQLNGQFRVRDPKLTELLQLVREIVARKNLNVKFVWIPRAENLAGKLL
jgi:ribonuclease HI